MKYIQTVRISAASLSLAIQQLSLPTRHLIILCAPCLLLHHHHHFSPLTSHTNQVSVWLLNLLFPPHWYMLQVLVHTIQTGKARTLFWFLLIVQTNCGSIQLEWKDHLFQSLKLHRIYRRKGQRMCFEFWYKRWQHLWISSSSGKTFIIPLQDCSDCSKTGVGVCHFIG